MAEVVAGIAVASAFLQVIDVAARVIKHVAETSKQLDQVPKSLQGLVANVELLQESLRQSETYFAHLKVAAPTQAAVENVPKSCSRELQELDALIQKGVVSSLDSRWRRGRKALRMVLQERKIQELQGSMRDHVQALTFYQTTIMMQQTSTVNPTDMFELPFNLDGVPITPSFVAREHELAVLASWCSPSVTSSAQGRRRTTAVVYGLGGIGKTQLVVEFIRTRASEFSAVIWLDGRNEQSLRSSLSSLSANLPGVSSDGGALSTDDERLQHVLKWLSLPKNDRWLIIVDNVDCDPDGATSDGYKLQQYLPSADHGAIIITTRLARVVAMGIPLELGAMNGDQSIRALEARIGFTTQHEDEKQHMIKLVERLGGLPLALAQAGAYIRETQCSISDYIELYSASWERIMKAAEADELMRVDYSNGSIWTTWDVTFDRITVVNPRAAHLLRLWSCLDEKGLWYELVGRGAQFDESLKREAPWFYELADKFNFLRSIGVLVNHSLVQKRHDIHAYTMHPVVHQRLRYNPRTEHRQVYGQLACLAVASNVPLTTHSGYWQQQKRLLPHAERCFEWFQSSSALDSQLLRMLQELAAYFVDYDLYDKAEVIFERVLAGTSNELDTYERRSAKANLACIWYEQRKHEQARTMYYEVITDPPPDAAMGKLIATTKGNLGRVLDAQDLGEEALKMYQAAYDEFREEVGEDHVETILALMNLGGAQEERGRFEQASRALQKCCARFASLLGPGHPLTVKSMNKLAMSLMDQGGRGPQEAERLLRAVCVRCKASFGPDDPQVLQNSITLCALLTDHEKYTEAIEHCNNVISAQTVFDLTDWGTFWIRQQLGRSLQSIKESSHARAVFEDMLVEVTNKLGAYHTWTLALVNNIGTTFDQPAAITYYERAFEGYAATSGLHQSAAMDTMVNLGTSYEGLGRLEEAERMLRMAVDGYVAIEGLRKKYTQSAIIFLVSFLQHHDKASEAAALGEDYLTRTTEIVGSGHVFVVGLLSKLGDIYYQIGDSDAARLAWLRALQALEQQEENKPAEVGRILYNLANATEDNGYLEDAVPLYERSLAIRQECLGKSHAHTADTAGNLAVLLHKLGRRPRAIELLLFCVEVREQHSPEQFAKMDGYTAVERWQRELEASEATIAAGADELADRAIRRRRSC